MTQKRFFLLLSLLVAVLALLWFQPNGETVEDHEIAEIFEREEEKRPVFEEEAIEIRGDDEIVSEEDIFEEEEEKPVFEEELFVMIDDDPKIIEEVPTSKVEVRNDGEVQEGIASWYGSKFHGRRTASGEIYDMYDMTAAHKELEFGTMVRVTHSRSGRYVDVRINDRGPFIKGRVIDLSMQAAQEIGLKGEGIAEVKIEVIESP